MRHPIPNIQVEEKYQKIAGKLESFPALIIILIGPSRVYLGDHWASDVLGGYLLGSSWLTLAVRAYLKLREQSNRGKYLLFFRRFAHGRE